MSKTGAPLIACTGLTKSFGSLKALDGVSLSVGAGEALGIVGPNGAGKTTLFGALAGTFPVSAGEIAFAGAQITHLFAETRSRLGIARTYQVPRPFLGLTVFENVLVAARAGGGQGQGPAVEAAAELLDRCGLRAEANAPAAALGLLDRKRLELTRALGFADRVICMAEGVVELEGRPDTLTKAAITRTCFGIHEEPADA